MSTASIFHVNHQRCLAPASDQTTVVNRAFQSARKDKLLEVSTRRLPGFRHACNSDNQKLSPKLRSSVALSLSVPSSLCLFLCPVLLPPLVLAIYLSFCLPIYVLLLLAIYLPTCPPVSLYHECMELSKVHLYAYECMPGGRYVAR